MKNILVFSIFIIFISCQIAEKKEKIKKKYLKQFRKEIFDCIIENEKSSNFLKKKIKDYMDEDYEKILRVFISRLSNKDRNIIRKCRKNYFRKVKIFISKNYTEDNFNLTDLTENLTIPSSSYINSSNNISLANYSAGDNNSSNFNSSSASNSINNNSSNFNSSSTSNSINNNSNASSSSKQ